MRLLFADTFYFVALLNSRDQGHQRALHVTVIAQTRDLFLSALDLYESRSDKAYSLTDCISMNVMRSEGLTDVLTNDHHFEQEGFTRLFL